MKRPFAVIGFTYLFSLVLATYCTAEISRILILVFLGLFIVSLLVKPVRKKGIIPVALLTVSVAMGVYSWFYITTAEPIHLLNDKDATISATICELPYKKYNKYYYTMKTDSVEIDGMDDVPQNIKLTVSLSKAFDADVYDKISGKVHLFTKENVGFFSPQNTYAAKGIHISAYLYEFENYTEEPGTQRPIYYYFLKCRQALNGSLRMLFPDNYWPVASGVLLGDTHAIQDDVKSDFRDVGVSHLLSVSGLNTSIVAQFLVTVFLFLKLKPKLANALSCVGIVLFMGITGFVPSIVRAGIMLILYYVAKLFDTNADSLNSLGIAVLIIAGSNPFSGGDISLLLSFCATLGMVLFSGRLEMFIKSNAQKLKYGKKVIDKIASPVAITTCATVFTLPITILCFNKVSLIGVIANILVVFPAVVALVVTLFAAVLYLVWPLQFIAMPLGLVAGLLINYITFCVKVLAKVPLAVVSTSQPFMKFWLASLVLLVAVSVLLGGSPNLVRVCGLLTAVLLFSGILSYQIINRNITSLAVLDTGDGATVVLTKPGRSAVVSCGGDSFRYSELSRYLESKNVKRLDYMFLSDFKDETASLAQSAIDEYTPYYVILPDRDDIGSKLSRTVADSETVKYFTAKANAEVCDNVIMTAVNEDNQSFLYLTVNGVNVLVCPSGGDAACIPQQYRTCDVLIQGSRMETLKSVKSTYAVEACGAEKAPKNMQWAADSGKIPVATGGDGAVVIDFLGGKNIYLRRIK